MPARTRERFPAVATSLGSSGNNSARRPDPGSARPCLPPKDAARVPARDRAASTASAVVLVAQSRRRFPSVSNTYSPCSRWTRVTSVHSKTGIGSAEVPPDAALAVGGPRNQETPRGGTSPVKPLRRRASTSVRLCISAYRVIISRTPESVTPSSSISCIASLNASCVASFSIMLKQAASSGALCRFPRATPPRGLALSRQASSSALRECMQRMARVYAAQPRAVGQRRSKASSAASAES